MNSPLVSILLPNYNHALFLPQRLQSIYQQTYPNFEVILLDDNSTDNSTELLKKYAQHPKTSHYLVNKKNSGSPFHQWKKGIELAQGKYIWIAESDDWASIDFLEKLISVLEQDKEIALAYCQSKKVNKAGRVIDDMIRYTGMFRLNKWKAGFINDGNAEIENYLVYKNTIPNASAVVFRNRANIIDFVNTEMQMAGDWWFWVHLIRGYKIAFIPERLNFHRSHPQTTRFISSLAKQFQQIKEQKIVIDNIQAKHHLNNQQSLKATNRLLHDLLHTVSSADYPATRAFIQTHFPTAPPFPQLLIQAHLQRVKNKFIGLKSKMLLQLN